METFANRRRKASHNFELRSSQARQLATSAHLDSCCGLQYCEAIERMIWQYLLGQPAIANTCWDFDWVGSGMASQPGWTTKSSQTSLCSFPSVLTAQRGLFATKTNEENKDDKRAKIK